MKFDSWNVSPWSRLKLQRDLTSILNSILSRDKETNNYENILKLCRETK